MDTLKYGIIYTNKGEKLKNYETKEKAKELFCFFDINENLSECLKSKHK